MQAAEIVACEVNRLHSNMVLEALAMSLSQSGQSLAVQSELLVKRLNVRSADVVNVWRTEYNPLLC